jgi:hypothetical protein
MSCAAHKVSEPDCQWCKNGSNRGQTVQPVMKPISGGSKQRITYKANRPDKSQFVKVNIPENDSTPPTTTTTLYQRD